MSHRDPEPIRLTDPDHPEAGWTDEPEDEPAGDPEATFEVTPYDQDGMPIWE